MIPPSFKSLSHLKHGQVEERLLYIQWIDKDKMTPASYLTLGRNSNVPNVLFKVTGSAQTQQMAVKPFYLHGFVNNVPAVILTA